MKAIIAATIIGVILMFTGIMVKEKKGVSTFAAILFFLLLGVNVWELSGLDPNQPQVYFNNMLFIDRYVVWFNTLMTGCTLLYVLLSGREIQKVGIHVSDYFALISFMLVGLYMLSGFHNMLILFLGIEIISIPQYILAGADKKNLKSSEASLKYFLMGAFSTGILLMGITLLYGATGSFDIANFTFLELDKLNPMALCGIVFLIIAFAFKVSAAPMHMWTPDVYDGAPTPFTAYMSTIVKAAGFFAFVRLFHTSFGKLAPSWVMIIAVITAATLLVGNITAVFQQSVKRMMAYSSIAQAGFMLFAVLSVKFNAVAWQGILIYAVAYTIATMGVFAVLMKMKDFTYDGFNGLGKREPLLAFVTTVFLLSLAGIPLTGGFIAKYYVLVAAVQQGNVLWLVIFALLMAAISVYYYFRVIMAMYFKQGSPELSSPVTPGDRFMLVLTCILVLVLGIAPQLLLSFI